MSRFEEMAKELPDWIKYEPTDFSYVRFPTNIVAACFKIIDVFHSVCNGRAALIFADTSDIGNMLPPRYN